MSFQEDPRLMEAKVYPLDRLVDRLCIEGLVRTSGELIGPCPKCGGRDRFGINISSRAFNCRQCELKGGDQIALVMQLLGKPFRDALTWIVGELPPDLDPKEAARRRALAKKTAEREERDRNTYRRQAIKDAQSMWARSRPGQIGIVGTYLKARGIEGLAVPDCLRFLLDHPCVKKFGREYVTLHRGPCMIAGIFNRAGALTAVHQTWVDNSPPHGKAKICHDGKKVSSKLVRGSKKGGVIPLVTPQGADTLVMGEGIETTLSAYVARPAGFERAAYWAGVDLGNMAGRMEKSGKRGVLSGVPDLSDEVAFVPPEWVKRLVFIMDGDSDPVKTRAQLESGLFRAMHYRPGILAQIVQAGEGHDLNDILTGAETNE